MKKLIIMLLVGLMVLGSSIAVFAEEPGDILTGDTLGEEQMSERLSLKKEFTEEIHQINALRIERNQIQIQVIEKQDQLVDLYIEAREDGNKEALEAAKAERSQLKGIHEEIKALHEQAAATRQAFKEALKNDDMEAADAEMGKLIEIHSSINSKIEEKVEVLNAVIDILS